MSGEPSISQNAKTVLEAVHKLYHDSSPIEKDKASRWLGDFQQSVSNIFVFNILLFDYIKLSRF